MTHTAVAVLSGGFVLIGALVRGYAGFGASLLWVASLSLLHPPLLVVPTVLALEALVGLDLLRSVRGDIEWSSMRWLLPASLLLTPVGVALLAIVPERPMRVAVGSLVLAATLALAVGPRRQGPPTRGAAVLAGGASGLVNGATGIGGPPAVILYFSGEDLHVGRSTLAMYFLSMDAFALLVMAARGLVDASVLSLTAWYAPLALAGTWVGKRAYRRFGTSGFRGIVLILLTVLGAATLLRALLAR